MRVLVAAVSQASSISGIQRHALNLTRCLTALPNVSAVDLVISAWQVKILSQTGLEPGARLKVHITPASDGPIGRNLWYYSNLPRWVERLRPDVVHLTYPVPVSAKAYACPIVVSLHDLYPLEIPENFRSGKVFFNRLVLKKCLHSVDAIACVSDTTLLRLRDHMPQTVWRKAVRVFNCVEPEPATSSRSPLSGLQDGQFLLCVAQHRRNKNIPLILRVFRRLLLGSAVTLSMSLVIIGINGPETKTISRMITDLGLSHRVQLIQGIAESELQWCYAHCAAVVVPSTTEGFGLPVAEALLAGCRVICSDIDVLREIGGEHCWFVPLGPEAEAAFANTIAQSLRQNRPGKIALPHLSAATLGAEYLSLYSRLLALNVQQQTGFAQVTDTGLAGVPLQHNHNLQEVRRGRV